MKWFILIVGAWFVIIVGIVIYSHSHGKSVPVLPQNKQSISSNQISKGGPTVGDEITNIETPEQIVTRYLQYVNKGDVDMASSLIDPNVMIDYTSKRQGISSNEAVQQYVTLFPAQGAVKIEVLKGIVAENHASISAHVTFNTMPAKDFTFSLKLSKGDSHSKEQIWLITNQQVGKGQVNIPPSDPSQSQPRLQTGTIQPMELADKVSLFFNLINDGKLDGAAALYDPNILMMAVSRDKNRDPRQATLDFVHIFDLGQMTSVTVKAADVPISSDKTFKAELQMKVGPLKVYTVTLKHIVIDATSRKTEWYIKSVVNDPTAADKKTDDK